MPFDNIKTRMQSMSSTKRMGMSSLALQMLRTEGIAVFWRATTPRLVRLTVSEALIPADGKHYADFHSQMSSAITFTCFNQIVLLAAWFKQQKVHQPFSMPKSSES